MLVRILQVDELRNDINLLVRQGKLDEALDSLGDDGSAQVHW